MVIHGLRLVVWLIGQTLGREKIAGLASRKFGEEL